MVLIHQIIYGLLAILFFILSVPHTIAVRNIVSAILLVLVGFIFFQEKRWNSFGRFLKQKVLYYINLLLVLFSFWIVLQALIVSPEPLWALKESKQWFVGLLYYVIGMMIAYRYDVQKISTIIFFSLFVHILFIDLYVIRGFVYEHRIIQYFGGLMPRDYASYVTNTVWMFLVAEVTIRSVWRKRLLPINQVTLLFLILLAGTASMVEMTRNAFVPLVFIILLSGYIYVKMHMSNIALRSKISILLVVMMILGSGGVYLAKHDRRFSHIIDVFPVAVQLEKYKCWMNPQKYNFPKNMMGEQVNTSNYLRIAWAYAGIGIIQKNPFGVGYGRNAFGHAVRRYYPEAKVGHSHSGIIDLTIGIGIVGLFFWGLFVGYLLFRVWRGIIVEREVVYSTLLLYIVVEFLIRSVLDSNMRDHMLLTFMFLVGFLLWVINNGAEPKR